jgi:hypothetical protein
LASSKIGSRSRKSRGRERGAGGGVWGARIRLGRRAVLGQEESATSPARYPASASSRFRGWAPAMAWPRFWAMMGRMRDERAIQACRFQTVQPGTCPSDRRRVIDSKRAVSPPPAAFMRSSIPGVRAYGTPKRLPDSQLTPARRERGVHPAVTDGFDGRSAATSRPRIPRGGAKSRRGASRMAYRRRAARSAHRADQEMGTTRRTSKGELSP